MEFIFGFVFFIFTSYISFYMPGKLVLSRVFRFSSEITSFLSWPVGIALFLFGIYVSAWLHLTYLYLGIIVGVFIFAFFKEKSLFTINLKISDKFSLGIISIGSLLFFSLTAFSYIQTKDGLQFIGSTNVMDGLLHIAYTHGLLTTFPPSHAGLANVPLRGYHYFYDLFMSRLVLFYHFTTADLYYRYLPLFISLLYGGGFYFVTLQLTDNKLSQRLVLFFAYFAQSFAFVLSFFIPSIPPIAELGSVYPLELILNPAIILSVGMLLSFLYILFEIKPKLSQYIFLGFLFGILVELKVYTGIIGVSAFMIFLFLRLMYKPRYFMQYFFGFITMTLVVIITYIPNNFGAGSLWFAPFFAYSVYMQEPPFISWHWELKRVIFQQHHNIPHLIFLYAQAIGLFWFLSLGSRVVLLLGISYFFKRSFWKEEKNLVVLMMVAVPICIGSLFVQSVSIFDTKQFFWIAGSLVAIPAGLSLGGVLKMSNKVFIYSVISIVIAFSFRGVWGQVNRFVLHPAKYTIPTEEQVFFEKVAQKIPQNAYITYLARVDKANIMSYPFSLSPVVAVLTGRPTYYEVESAQFDIKQIYEERKNTLSLLSEAIAICNTGEIKKQFNKTGGSVLITMQNKCLDGLGGQKLYAKDNIAAYFIKK